MAFNIHYCGDKIASISLKSEIPTSDKIKECCKKSVSEKHSCCKDKVFHFQKKADTLMSKVFAFHLDYSFVMIDWNPIAFMSVSDFKNSQITTYYCNANAPPLYKLYNQYVFYA